jgi:hypothetical protein
MCLLWIDILYSLDFYPCASCATKVVFVFCSEITADSLFAVNECKEAFQYICMLLL